MSNDIEVQRARVRALVGAADRRSTYKWALDPNAVRPAVRRRIEMALAAVERDLANGVSPDAIAATPEFR